MLNPEPESQVELLTKIRKIENREWLPANRNSGDATGAGE